MRGPAFFKMKAGKRDANGRSIIVALEKLGHIVADLGGAAGGVPDLAVRHPRWATGRWEFVEIKTLDGELTPAQTKLHQEWLMKGVTVHVVHSLDEALGVLR